MRNKSLDFKIGTQIEDWTIISNPKNRPTLTSGQKGALYYDLQCKCGTCRKAEPEEINSVLKKGFHKDLNKACKKCLTEERKSSRTINQNLVSVYLSYKHAAKKRSKEFSLSKEFTLNLMQKNCYYCGIEPSNNMKNRNNTVTYSGIDRLDNTLGYLESNCVACCSMCNVAKNNYSLDEFSSWLSRIYNYNVQRSERKLVGSSEPKWKPSFIKEDDMI